MIRFIRILKKNLNVQDIRLFHKNNQSVTYSRLLRDMPKTQCSVLPSGLTVATEERNCSNVCIGFYIDAGSRYENESENGVTHCFEHIAFKGTQTKSKTCLESEISKTGAKFKCFTTRETCIYYAECLSAEAKCVADILFHSVFNNAFSDIEIEIQKKIVYDEMLLHDKSTAKILHDYLHSTAFQGTRLSQTVMGPSKNLCNIKSSLICDYITKMFIPQRIVFAAVGGIKHDLMLSLGEENFIKTEPTNNITLGSNRYTGSQLVYRDDSMEVAYVAIAVEGPSFGDEDKIILDLASSVFGGWDASQLSGINHGVNVAHAASTSGLCTYYKPFSYYYQDVGLWGVEFISSRAEVDNMLLTVQSEFMRLCCLITDGELLRAKNEMKSKLIANLQSSVKACHEIGFNLLRTGRRLEIKELTDTIDKITADDIKKVCNTYIYDRCPVVVGIGSTENLMPYSRIRSYMYWLRV